MSFKARLMAAAMAGSMGLGGAMLPAHADDATQPAAQPITVTIPGAALDSAIHDYLRRNPEAVGEALAAFQVKQQRQQQQQAQAAVGGEASKIYDDPASPVAGNPNGNETIVEFFDYSCHYCKQIHPDLQTLIKDDSQVKIIFKDIPILGQGSVVAAKAALAAKMQGKYMPMHDALLDYKGQFDDAAVQQLAQNVGLDYAKLKTDMESPDVRKQLDANAQLANTLDIHGTPSLIINKQIYPGAIPLAELKEKVKDHTPG